MKSAGFTAMPSPPHPAGFCLGFFLISSPAISTYHIVFSNIYRKSCKPFIFMHIYRKTKMVILVAFVFINIYRNTFILCFLFFRIRKILLSVLF